MRSKNVLIWLRSGLETYNVRENNINTVSCIIGREASDKFAIIITIQPSLALILLSAGNNVSGIYGRMFACLRIASVWLNVLDNPYNSIRLQTLHIPYIPGRLKYLLYEQHASKKLKDPTEAHLSARSSLTLPHHDGSSHAILRAQRHKHSCPSRF